VVGVDSPTLRYFASATAVKDKYAADWPFPRRDHARVIDNLDKAGAKHIAIDIQFSQPSPYGTADDYALAAALAEPSTWCSPRDGRCARSDRLLGGNANLEAVRRCGGGGRH